MTLVYYTLHCGNEWCGGPLTFGTVDDEEPPPTRCPGCGWTARLGRKGPNGILRHVIPDEYDTRIPLPDAEKAGKR